MLVIVCGLQGTGKTTVAEKIAGKINGVLLRTDVIRKEILKNPIYSEEERQEIYDEMFLRTKDLLKENEYVILDAVFAKKENRKKAKKISKDFKIIETICPEKIVKERMKNRFEDESEARFEHYLKYKKLFEPITEEHIIIDTSKNMDRQLEKFF